MATYRLIAQSLTRRYLIALILVGLLSTAAWLSLHLVITEQESNAALVNVSGRQRMLSQRTALFSSLLVNAAPGQRQEIRDKLRAAADLMRDSHRGLTQGDASLGLPQTMSDTMRALYYQPPLALDAQVRTYLGHVTALLDADGTTLGLDNPHYRAIISQAPGPLVAGLDQAVSQYQREGETAVRWLLWAETSVWLLTLLLLSLEAAFIFRPFVRQLRRVIDELHQTTEDLLHSKAVLEQRVEERTAELRHIAQFDPLTGIPNRRMLAEKLNQDLARARRQGKLLAVCYLDLDGFKPINDLHGHETGDAMLVEIAQRLRRVLRTEDTLSRLGGDEFVLILADLDDPEEIDPILQRVLEAVNGVLRINDILLRVTASIGVTLYPDDPADTDTLLRHADQAMYQAKEAGKNRYQLFDPEQDRRMQSHREQLHRLGEALERQEFVLHYQPKVNMRSGLAIGVEALVRWRHPERGLLPPGEFLPCLAGQPLTIRLGEWVLETALRQIETWKAAGLRLPVSVNIDALHLEQADFVDRLSERIAQHPNVEPGDLELEILETSALQDVALVSGIMLECQRLGVGFALDDFGTGYSSLTYLKRLPAGLLKVDQSFVRDMLDDPEDLAILEGVLGLAHAFRREVIAEGVETAAHGELLLRLNCELGQGYAIARPMPAQDIPFWLTQWRPDPAWTHAPSVRRDDLPILFAAVEHRAWIAQVLAYLQDEGSLMPQLDHQQCRFGHWLSQQAAYSHGDHPVLRQLIPMHLALHDRVKRLITLKQQGQPEQVLAGSEALLAARDELLSTLLSMLERPKDN
ncbi:MAG: EAL domain-containing protein [Pseudomonadota bacterium]